MSASNTRGFGVNPANIAPPPLPTVPMPMAVKTPSLSSSSSDGVSFPSRKKSDAVKMSYSPHRTGGGGGSATSKNDKGGERKKPGRPTLASMGKRTREQQIEDMEKQLNEISSFIKKGQRDDSDAIVRAKRAMDNAYMSGMRDSFMQSEMPRLIEAEKAKASKEFLATSQARIDELCAIEAEKTRALIRAEETERIRAQIREAETPLIREDIEVNELNRIQEEQFENAARKIASAILANIEKEKKQT